jgi:hypothetical protein
MHRKWATRARPYLPLASTSKSVVGLEGATVWLVAGEGRSPKSYYLASRFVIEECAPDKHTGTKLPNEASGTGVLFGTTFALNTTVLLEQLRKLSANFVNGFFELRDPATIAALKALG